MRNIVKDYAKWLLEEMPSPPEDWDRRGDGARYLHAILNPANQNCAEEWALTINYVRAKLLELHPYRVYPLVCFLEQLRDRYNEHRAKPALLKWALGAKGWI